MFKNDRHKNKLKPFNIEDLLEMTSFKKEDTNLQSSYSNKKILITGAAGSLGSVLAKRLIRLNIKQIVLVDQAESALYNLQQNLLQQQRNNAVAIIADISNKKRVAQIFKQYQPQIIFHTAAYKHVPLMEENPFEAIRVNVLGTQIVSDLALKHKVEKFVMISTDKAVNPTNVMGATKRVAEMYMRCLNNEGKTKFITTRFGNVLGSNGSVIPLFKSQIENGGPLTVTHKDITRYFMTIPEACQLVLEVGVMGNGGELFVFDMGDPIKIYDLAKKMIHLSGLRFPEDIAIKIIGLRPGEKRHEELLTNTEKKLPTYHDKIKIIQQAPIDCDALNNGIIKLRSLRNKDNKALVAQLKQIVPEYISNNSVFESLDKKLVSSQ